MGFRFIFDSFLPSLPFLSYNGSRRSVPGFRLPRAPGYRAQLDARAGARGFGVRVRRHPGRRDGTRQDLDDSGSAAERAGGAHAAARTARPAAAVGGGP